MKAIVLALLLALIPQIVEKSECKCGPGCQCDKGQCCDCVK